MAKKIILALIILIFIAVTFLGVTSFINDSVDIYFDGENVTVSTYTISDIDKDGLNKAICKYSVDLMDNTTADINSYKNGVNEICRNYGLENPEIKIDSSIGENQIPVIVNVEGTSMLPTLQDGQKVLINKTHNINVGDMVVADSSEYGGIIKRVDDIEGRSVHLVSDNQEISYERINGNLYEVKGISTWVDISNINGVVIQY